MGKNAAQDDVEPRLELQRLRILESTGLLTGPTPCELDEICHRVRQQFRVTIAMVTLLDEERLVAKARAGTDLKEVPRGGQFCDYTIRSDEVFVVPNATLDPRFASSPLVMGDPFLRFYAGAPLIYPRGARLGALCVLDPGPREFSLGDRAELAAAADEVVGVIMERSFNEMSVCAGLKGGRDKPVGS